MKTFKIILLNILIISQCLASEMSYSELREVLRKSWKDEPLNEWKVYLNSVLKNELRYALSEYSMPNVNFFDNPELKGEPIATVKEDGFFLGNKKICGRKPDFSVVLKPHYKVDYFHNPSREKSSCSQSTLTLQYRGKYTPYLVLNLEELNGKIGKARIEDKIAYIDISVFEGAFILKPTKLRLTEFLGVEEFEKVDKIMSTIRSLMLKKDVVGLNTFFIKQCLLDYKSDQREKGLKKCQKTINDRNYKYYEKNKFLESTFYESHELSYTDGDKSDFYFYSYSGVQNLRFVKVFGSWQMDKFETEDISVIPSMIKYLQKSK